MRVRHDGSDRDRLLMRTSRALHFPAGIEDRVLRVTTLRAYIALAIFDSVEVVDAIVLCPERVE